MARKKVNSTQGVSVNDELVKNLRKYTFHLTQELSSSFEARSALLSTLLSTSPSSSQTSHSSNLNPLNLLHFLCCCIAGAIFSHEKYSSKSHSSICLDWFGLFGKLTSSSSNLFAKIIDLEDMEDPDLDEITSDQEEDVPLSMAGKSGLLLSDKEQLEILNFLRDAFAGLIQKGTGRKWRLGREIWLASGDLHYLTGDYSLAFKYILYHMNSEIRNINYIYYRYYVNGLALTTRHYSRLDFLSSSIFSKRGLFDRILSSASRSGGNSF
jgi:hypothetical protein